MSSDVQSRPITIAAQVRITAVMSKDLISVSSDTSIREAAGRMGAEGIGSCLVMDADNLGGIITEQDMARRVVAGGLDAQTVPVSRVMSSPVVTTGTEGTVGDVADLMIRHRIRRVVVMEDGRPVGIVTARDLLGFVSRMNTILQELSGMYGTLMFLNYGMEVLWVNKDQDGVHMDAAGPGPVHCYELLHGSTSPCPGCPLVLSGEMTGDAVRTSEVIDPDRRVWQVQCHPVTWGDGTVIGVIESAIEVTREREMEEVLRDQQNQLHVAAEGADIETWCMRTGPEGPVFGSEGGVVFALETRFVGTGELFGYLHPRVHPDDMPLVRAMVDDLAVGTRRTAEVQFRMLVPGGGWRRVRTLGQVVEMAPDGSAIAVAGVNIDVTDLMNYQEALQRMNKKLNLLSSVTRHDILNQVSAIMLAGELLDLDGYLEGDAGLADNIRRMLASAETIEHQALFTREYRSLGETDPAWQSVCQIAEDAFRDVGSDKVTVHLACGCEGLEVYADPMFGHVIYNLIENAIRHGDVTTAVALTFRDTREGGVLTVEDDGTGVPDDLKEMIFSRGYGTNTGFGLFLTREILEITGITIRECGVAGEGARFELIIPHSGYRFV